MRDADEGGQDGRSPFRHQRPPVRAFLQQVESICLSGERHNHRGRKTAGEEPRAAGSSGEKSRCRRPRCRPISSTSWRRLSATVPSSTRRGGELSSGATASSP